jgi:LmbE family N-acetylglucosaminyl deacetylase
MDSKPLRLLILGAHPDDAEYHAGGLAALYRRAGHEVKMVSLTDGSAGHHETPRAALAAIRREEAASAGRVIGARYDVWEFPDGELLPTLDVRRRIIREIRNFAPDLLLTHRVYDYHPDHRAVGQAVQDACFLVRVPHVVPDTPPLPRDPVVAYLPDLFTRPCPMTPDVALDISDRMETIAAMLACHASQVFEWLPYLDGVGHEVPKDEGGRRAWVRAWYCRSIRPRADRFRQALVAAYGEARASAIQYAEAYEISQYAAPADQAALLRLFPRGPATVERV